MNPAAHLSSGYVWYNVLKKKKSVKEKLLLIKVLAGSILPDIDALWGKTLATHRATLCHAPLFWLSIGLIFVVVTKCDKRKLIYILAFLVAVETHMFLDWLSGRSEGIMIFLPFSRQDYSLFPTNPAKGDVGIMPSREQVWFWRFYLENKILVAIEAGIILCGLGLWLRKRTGQSLRV